MNYRRNQQAQGQLVCAAHAASVNVLKQWAARGQLQRSEQRVTAVVELCQWPARGQLLSTAMGKELIGQLYDYTYNYGVRPYAFSIGVHYVTSTQLYGCHNYVSAAMKCMKHHYHINIVIDGNAIDRVRQAKVLGVTISADLS